MSIAAEDSGALMRMRSLGVIPDSECDLFAFPMSCRECDVRQIQSLLHDHMIRAVREALRVRSGFGDALSVIDDYMAFIAPVSS